MTITIHPVEGLPIIKEGDDLAELLINASSKQGTSVTNGDVLVVCHVIVSRAEGRIIDLKSVEPSVPAENFAAYTGKDPRLVEVVLREARAVRRMGPGVLVTETRQGFVCANSGVDKSNVPGEDIVAPLPLDPDTSASRIRARIRESSGCRRGGHRMRHARACPQGR